MLRRRGRPGTCGGDGAQSRAAGGHVGWRGGLGWDTWLMMMDVPAGDERAEERDEQQRVDAHVGVVALSLALADVAVHGARRHFSSAALSA